MATSTLFFKGLRKSLPWFTGNLLPRKVARKGGQKITAKQAIVLDLIKQNPAISRKDLAGILEINESAVRKHLDALKNKGIIQRVGPDKGGHWEVKI